MKEAESMKLQPKGGGKTVVFKDKDNYEKAKKSGDYEDPEGPGDGGEKEEPTGKLGGGDFDRDSEGEKDEPEGGEPEDAEKRKASAQAVSALGSDGSDEQAENLYQLVKTPEDRDDPVLGKEHEVESDDGDYTYDSPGWEIVQNIAVKARNSDDPAETFKKEFENAPPEVQEYILANIGKGKAESIKVINGQKYRPIKESVEPKKHLLRETYERIGGK
jgi:hypothetical protein